MATPISWCRAHHGYCVCRLFLSRLNKDNVNFKQMRLFATNESTSRYIIPKSQIPSFIDFLQIRARGGGGGQGLPKFGGFGGNGGRVVVIAKKNVKTLNQVLKKYPRQMCRAPTGENSDKFHLLGENGADLIVQVPVGVLVHKGDGSVEDLNLENDHCVIAKGGKGGNHETNFLGVKGEDNLVSLELKLLADVGLVGFPNAGKSTFLKAVSRAKPKIAAYPFTTVSPQLGTMEYEDSRMISVADLPGLIEGAHQNFGMGIKFLRHAERTKLLLHVLDINPFQLSHKYKERSPFETLLLLNKELDEYGHGMLDKPSILALNKVDTDESGLKVNRLMDLIKNLPDSLDQVPEELHPKTLVKFEDIFTMSAMNAKGLEAIKNRIRDVMDEYADLRRRQDMESDSNYLQKHREHNKTRLV